MTSAALSLQNMRRRHLSLDLKQFLSLLRLVVVGLRRVLHQETADCAREEKNSFVCFKAFHMERLMCRLLLFYRPKSNISPMLIEHMSKLVLGIKCTISLRGRSVDSYKFVSTLVIVNEWRCFLLASPWLFLTQRKTDLNRKPKRNIESKRKPEQEVLWFDVLVNVI